MQGLATGLMATGVQVTDFGLASTPGMFMSTVKSASEESDYDVFKGAVMITVSHLPFNRS